MVTHQEKMQLRVIVVEDNESDFQLLLRQLNRGPFAVKAERIDGEGAFRAALASNGIDAIFADYLLPSFNAQSALQVYKESGLDVPFIVVSGVIGDDTAVDMVSAGANDFLSKDDLSRLHPILERELNYSRARQENRALREEKRSEGLAETSAEMHIREHLEAIRRILSQIEDPSYREQLDTLLRPLEGFMNLVPGQPKTARASRR